MKKQRGIVALVGLFLLFGCAVISYTCENERSLRAIIIDCAKESGQTKQKGYITDKSKKTFDQNCAYGVSIVHVRAMDYRNLSNVKQSEKRKISPKKYLYRNSSRHLLLTKQDYESLIRIVEAEATGGTKQSKAMVADVVLNRVADEHFPNTVTEVVFQRGCNGVAQFSPIMDGRFQKITVSKETKCVVKKVLAGKDESSGALFFLNPRTSPSQNLQWFQNNLKYLFDCGGHSFYCYKNS